MVAVLNAYSNRNYDLDGFIYAFEFSKRMNLDASTDIQDFVTRAINAIAMDVSSDAAAKFSTIAKSIGYTA